MRSIPNLCVSSNLHSAGLVDARAGPSVPEAQLSGIAPTLSDAPGSHGGNASFALGPRAAAFTLRKVATETVTIAPARARD
jgi:hypothetical protein